MKIPKIYMELLIDRNNDGLVDFTEFLIGANADNDIIMR